MNQLSIYLGLWTKKSAQEIILDLSQFKNFFSIRLYDSVFIPDIKYATFPKEFKIHVKRPWIKNWIRFQINISKKQETILCDYLKKDGCTVPQALFNFLKDELDEAIRFFFTMGNISSPGKYEFTGCFSIYNEEFLDNLPSFVSLYSEGTLDDSHKSGEYPWPKLKKLPLEKTILWVSKQKGFFEGRNETPIGRTLNSFSYLFKDTHIDTEEMDIIWALGGLEALYISGATSNLDSKQEQLVQKAMLFLGDPPDKQHMRRAIKNMYQYRSRFLHGDSPIPSKATSHTDEFMDKYHKDSYAAHDFNFFAMQLLAASLQKLVLKDITSLEFEYKMVTT